MERYVIRSNEFSKLPKSAQELWFDWLLDNAKTGSNSASVFAETIGFDVSGNSPIEQIFHFAFNIVQFAEPNNDFNSYLHLESQYEIPRDIGKKYIADFLLSHDFMTSTSKPLLIECDGHDFHEKTKEQVAYRNERDLELKTNGYDVLHFSGSQIVKNPIKCAYRAYRYFEKNTEYHIPEEMFNG